MNPKIEKVISNNIGSYIFPFLWIHGENENTLREYVRAIHDASLSEFCVESRPHPDYCGDQWWRDLDIIIDEAKKLGMRFWILDDSHFPTGYANGALKSADMSLRRQSIVKKTVPCLQGQNIKLNKSEYISTPEWQPNLFEASSGLVNCLPTFDDDKFLCAVAVKVGGKTIDDIVVLSPDKDGVIEFTSSDGEWSIDLLYLTRNRGPHREYINMTDARSVGLLIDAVYEPHYARYANEFGKTIIGFFSDEPELGNGHLYEYGKMLQDIDDHTWSANIENGLRDKWGESFYKYLPLLWCADFCDECAGKARHDYMQVVTELVRTAFSEQLGDWCKSHGVKYIGHLIEDDNQHTRTGSGLGHFFRGESGQDFAGIDDIGGQVFPQGEFNGPYGLTGQPRNGLFYHYVLGKLGSSAAAIDSKKRGRAFCEIFGNYGWEEGVRLEKYLLDYFLVRGINRFVPHAFSPAPFPDPDCPPHFYAHGHNPQYRHFGALMRYGNAMCELFSGGKRICRVAVLYHAESEWLGDYTAPEMLAQSLFDNQIDFDFIPADVFVDTEKYGTRLGNSLTVNGNEYSAFIIPYAKYIPSSVALSAKKLAECGCTILYADGMPNGVYDGNTFAEYSDCKTAVATEKIADKLRDCGVADILISPKNNRLRVMRYEQDGNDMYLLINEGDRLYKGTIALPTTGECAMFDVWNGKLLPTISNKANGKTIVEIELYPLKSTVIVFGESCKTQKAKTDRMDCSNGWVRSVCKSIDYPHFESEKSVDLPDCLEKELPKFSGFVRYEKTLDLGQTDNIAVEITDAYEGVELFVNGKSLGIQVSPPFVYDLRGTIVSGKNKVVIEVATTLERELADLPDPTRSYLGLGPKVPTVPSGINGKVYLIKEKV